MPCKVTKTVETREITLQEFIRQKGDKPYSTYRQIAKSLNFLLAFGGSASVLASESLIPDWSLERIEEFMKENDCSKDMEVVKAKYPRETEETQKFIAVANFMRDRFFEGYPELLKRCEREYQYACKHGFTRTKFGNVRNLIELRLAGEWDKKNLSKTLSNLQKISYNYPAQNIEACVRGRAQREIVEFLKDHQFSSYSFNEIHDSIDFVLSKDPVEAAIVLIHSKHVLERKIPELEDMWVPLLVDVEISDLKDSHQYYKGGVSVEAFDFNIPDPRTPGEPLRDANGNILKLKWDQYTKFFDIYPFNVELNEKFDIQYFKERRDFYKNLGIDDPIQESIDEYIKEKGYII